MKVVVHNAETGETVERKATKKEKAQFEADQAAAAEREAAEKAEREAAHAARESARAKLASLGLTDEEVTALLP